MPPQCLLRANRPAGYGLGPVQESRALRPRPTMSQAAAPIIQKALAISSHVPLPNVANSESGVIVMFEHARQHTNPTLHQIG